MLKEKNNNITFELLLILYIISGYIKMFLLAYSINLRIDLTLTLAVVLTAYIFLSKVTLKNIFHKPIMLFLLFYIWIILTMFYSSSAAYLFNKVFLFSTNILVFVAPLYLSSKIEIKSILNKFILISSSLNLWFIAFILPNMYSSEIYERASGSYLTVSLYSGMNILMMLLLKDKLFKNKYINLLFIILNIILLILSGGRGGLVFMFLILTIYGIFYLKRIQLINILKSTLIIILTLYMFMTFTNQMKYIELTERSVSRLVLLYEFDKNDLGGNSIEKRLALLDFSYDKIFHSASSVLFGYGIGSFLYEWNGVDGRGYPHNIIVEIIFELGMIGLLIFLIFSRATLKYFKLTTLSWVGLYLLLNALKSSNLVDIRLVFFIFALILIDGSNNYYSRKKV